MDRIFIIAEAGVNHNGSLETARRLIDAAAAAGADAVKFQTFKTENLICRDAQKAAYQMETTDAAESQFEMLKKLELTPQMHEELMAYCRQKGIRFLSTPFDVDSLHDLVERGIELIKLPSGEITNYPLLREAVPNDLEVKRGVLLTGSNASGKSTFLRAVALSAVLAQTIFTCPARRYEAPVFRIYSSMSLKDDLIGGQSYYMVEIRAIKRILDQVKQAEEEHGCVLCFVDEVLRGTNTVERIAASTQIMKMLSAGHVICFAATHDIELTHLLEGSYENYHFEETIENGDISFNYLLKKGRAQSRNAIRLLEVMGYDEQVIREAEELAERFLKTGEWEEGRTGGEISGDR